MRLGNSLEKPCYSGKLPNFDLSYYSLIMMHKSIISILFISLFACGQKPQETKNATEISSKEIINTYQDLDGNKVLLEDFKGKRVFLNFWATWCKPCIKEMPDIETASKILKDEDYVFLLASDESVEKIQKFIKKSNFDLQFIQFNGSYETMNIFSLPTTLIFDREGKKTRHMTGTYEWSNEKVLKNLRSVL